MLPVYVRFGEVLAALDETISKKVEGGRAAKHLHHLVAVIGGGGGGLSKSIITRPRHSLETSWSVDVERCCRQRILVGLREVGRDDPHTRDVDIVCRTRTNTMVVCRG
jgi:hypothetical protein